MKLNSKQLRELTDTNLQKKIIRQPVYFIIDNIYDTYNIGGLFRLADAMAIKSLYICGSSQTPPNHKIIKASIGTYKIVPWEYKKTTSQAIKELRQKEKNILIVSIEQAPNSINYTQYHYQLPLGLIIGNETKGISQGILDLSDAIVEIPMHGINISLNVIISTAIVGYHIYHKLKI